MASDPYKNSKNEHAGPLLQGAQHMFGVQGNDLTILHVPTREKVIFPAFLDMFSDAYNSQWTAEDVYGRMDPISTFVNTKRAISVSWFVPADSFEHAARNLAKVNMLIGFLYPLYDNSRLGGATVINQGPLMRISFGNLIRNASTGSGLLGYVNGITFDPLLEYGMFNRKSVAGSSAGAGKAGKNSQMNEYYPKTFRLNFEFTVLHEHELGYRKVGKSFVYNAKGSHSLVDEDTFPYATPEGMKRGNDAKVKWRKENAANEAAANRAKAEKERKATRSQSPPTTPANVKQRKADAKKNSARADTVHTHPAAAIIPKNIGADHLDANAEAEIHAKRAAAVSKTLSPAMQEAFGTGDAP